MKRAREEEYEAVPVSVDFPSPPPPSDDADWAALPPDMWRLVGDYVADANTRLAWSYTCRAAYAALGDAGIGVSGLGMIAWAHARINRDPRNAVYHETSAIGLVGRAHRHIRPLVPPGTALGAALHAFLAANEHVSSLLAAFAHEGMELGRDFTIAGGCARALAVQFLVRHDPQHRRVHETVATYGRHHHDVDVFLSTQRTVEAVIPRDEYCASSKDPNRPSLLIEVAPRTPATLNRFALVDMTVQIIDWGMHHAPPYSSVTARITGFDFSCSQAALARVPMADHALTLMVTPAFEYALATRCLTATPVRSTRSGMPGTIVTLQDALDCSNPTFYNAVLVRRLFRRYRKYTTLGFLVPGLVVPKVWLGDETKQAKAATRGDTTTTNDYEDWFGTQ